MIKFYEDYAEIDEEADINKEDLRMLKFSTVSTHGYRLKENYCYIEYMGVILPSTIIKSVKIKKVGTNTYENFDIFFEIAGKKTYLFKLDEMPKYFMSYYCQNIYVDIKQDDCETYIIEIECIRPDTFYFNSLIDDIVKLSAKHFQYILKDKVITINLHQYYGRYEILSMDEYLKTGKPLINTFVDKIKSSSKSANKR